MQKPANKKPAKKKTVPYRATPYQVRAFTRLRLEGYSVQGYLNALIEEDLRVRNDKGWSA